MVEFIARLRDMLQGWRLQGTMRRLEWNTHTASLDAQEDGAGAPA